MLEKNYSKEAILKAIISEVKYRLGEESIPRIVKCLDQFSEDEVWKRPNENLVSMGNLILHLCGNVRQYIMFGLDGQPDQRQRQSEFNTQGPIAKSQLLNDLDQVFQDVSKVLDELSPEILTKTIKVQGMDYTGFGILMHVVEHFSYHVGQITWHTKLTRNMDMNYYEGKDLNLTG